MQCDICFRTAGKEWLCPTDARNILYESRIQNARVLLEKDALDQQITTLLAAQSKSKDGDGNSLALAASVVDTAAILAEKDQAIDRTKQIIAHADELRAKVDQAREEIAKRKASLTRRKSELASAANGVDARRARQTEDVEKSIRMTKYKWNQGHVTTASSRSFLCGEAAKLYGLKRIRRNGAVEEYSIGGMGIVDLRSMNSKSVFFLVPLENTNSIFAGASAAQISTALSHIVHLLMLSTHYLAIRLPAEITLPHRDYPLPTIFPLVSSYKHTNVPFPGTTPAQSSNNSPTTSRHTEQSNQPRPRPLFIKTPLPHLVNEDPVAYALFLEGVTLLAYNIAWLCKSQGIPMGEDCSFEDICNIGRNLFNLLIGSRPRPPPNSRTSSAQSTPTKGNGRDVDTDAEDKRNSSASVMGRYSHGSAHSFLGSAEGAEFIRSWKLPSPIKLADKLKAKLMSEAANAEWDELQERDWEIEDAMGDDGVVVGARREGDRNNRFGMHSVMSIRTVMDAVEMVGPDGDRKPGTSGWTKVKPREQGR
jgi:hypothetical protein